jgi:hypothetical protein
MTYHWLNDLPIYPAIGIRNTPYVTPPRYHITRCTGPLHPTAWFFCPKANLVRIRERIHERIRERIREAILADERSRRTTGILRV